MKPVGQLEGALWRIVWLRAGDRLTHRVEVLEGGEYRELLASVEGTSDEAWPASPPLQEVHFEDRPGGSRVALLVGMAGKSHWSASVEMNAAGQRATFELACRAKVQPEWLGSAYDMASAFAAVATEAGYQLGAVELKLGATGSLSASVSSSGQALADKLPLAPGRITIAAGSGSTVWPQTIVWAYSFEYPADS